jgi:hypothetical protein
MCHDGSLGSGEIVPGLMREVTACARLPYHMTLEDVCRAFLEREQLYGKVGADKYAQPNPTR